MPEESTKANASGRRAWWISAGFAAGVVAIGLTARQEIANWWAHRQATPLACESTFVSIGVEEPSGIAYHPARNSLIVVGDQGQIAELDLSFRVLHEHRILGDLEAVTIHPQRGTVFVVSEEDRAVMEYDLDAGRVVRTMIVDYEAYPELAGKGDDNLGLEGLCFVPDTAGGPPRLFAVLQRKPARLIELAYSPDIAPSVKAQTKKAQAKKEQTNKIESRLDGPTEPIRILKMIDVGIDSLADVMYEPGLGKFILLSSSARIAAVCTPNGDVRFRFRLPGKKPEGLTFLPNGDMLVAQDTGGLWRVSAGLSAVRSALHVDN